MTTLSPESQAKIQAILDKIIWLDIVEVGLLTQLNSFEVGVNADKNAALGNTSTDAATTEAATEPVPAPVKAIF